jgi:uncharacterized coiled-coil protein SlyX
LVIGTWLFYPQANRMSEGHEERLVKIESVLAHLEQLTESLNETVAGQDKALRRLTQQMDQLTDRIAAEDIKAAKDNTTKPPHYG